MPASKKLFKAAQIIFKQIRKLSTAAAKKIVNFVLRGLLAIGKRPDFSKAGFALATTMMVLLVVALLSASLVLRSSDRSKTASNTRQDQVIQNSATPAIDRARAKLDALLSDPALPRGTPPDTKMLGVMAADPKKYTFADETRLKLAFDLDGSGTVVTTNTYAKTDETLDTAWKFPVDTDGNGKFDSLTVYGLFWRVPDPNVKDPITNQPRKKRQPLEARTLSQDANSTSTNCATAGQSAATSVEGGDWYKNPNSSELSKAFYAYAATVPITQAALDSGQIAPLAGQTFEAFKGNKAFAGIEYQQDRYRLSLNNTSVWYQDDIILGPGADFNLNGRVFTNSNLLIGGYGGAKIRLYQVSSENSCFYLEENSKINIGGNVGTGDISEAKDYEEVTVDLFNGSGNTPGTGKINSATRSTTSAGGNKVAYNDAAYRQRISLMTRTALSFCTSNCDSTKPDEPTGTTVSAITQYPTDLKTSFTEKYDKNKAQNYPKKSYDILADEIQIYLENRTRRVPYAEVADPDGTGAKGSYDVSNNNVDPSVFASLLDPPQIWREPTDANTKLTLVPANLPQTQPEIQQNLKKEKYLGDRVIAGNNLPARWKNSSGVYIGQDPRTDQQMYGASNKWTDPLTERYRVTQVQEKTDLGISDRNGFWEVAAAYDPSVATNQNTGGGGLRVITGSGIYVDDDKQKKTDSFTPSFPRKDLTVANAYKTSFLPAPTLEPVVEAAVKEAALQNKPDYIGKFKGLDNIYVWPDLMPMSGGPKQNGKGDLLMRATAVYHYADSAKTVIPNKKQEPIACISSYYDPTDAITARNPSGLPDVSGVPASPQPTAAQGARSNNGVVYAFPGRTNIGIYQTKLERQARLVFPNGRVANPLLRSAMTAYDGTTDKFQLSDFSAVDTAICSLAILDKTIGTPTEAVIKHGVIKEATFLDAREVKAIDKTTDPERKDRAYRKNDPVTTQKELGEFTVGAKDYRTAKTSSIALDKNYDLALEQRQPLEIRVTDIDVTKLAATEHGTFDASNDGTAETEYLLPNSGIIYASRDDALPDRSDSGDKDESKNPALSSTDFKLDPTRRPNGIRIINSNGPNGVTILARGSGNTFRKEERGLILVTNDPAYIKGHFNLHLPSRTTTFNPSSDSELEEFNASLNATWGNFYGRGSAGVSDLNQQFACRDGQPLCKSPGDQWRPASIIADAVTLQSVKFQDGYRSSGDFDVRNNGGALLVDKRLTNGFYENSFVTSSQWFKADNYPENKYPETLPLPSRLSPGSYLVNGVTPIQRRVTQFPEYLMEICYKLPVSECGPQDWVVGYNLNGGDLDDPAEGAGSPDPTFDLNKNGKIDSDFKERDIRLADLSDAIQLSNSFFNSAKLGSGTTATLPLSIYQRYPRRVAFQRNALGQLIVDPDTNPAITPPTRYTARPIVPQDPLKGITYSSVPSPAETTTKTPQLKDNALWFVTTTENSARVLDKTKPVSNINPSAARSFGNTNPVNTNLLYYRPLDKNDRKWEQYEMLLPDPSIPDKLAVLLAAMNGNTPTTDTLTPADHTVCISNAESDKYSVPVSSPLTGICSEFSKVAGVKTALEALPNDTVDTTAWDGKSSQGDATVIDPIYGATDYLKKPRIKLIDADVVDVGTTRDGVVVYELPPTANIIGSNWPVKIVFKGNLDSIFVIKNSSTKLTFGSSPGNPGVQIVLDGVDPNNIFWVSNDIEFTPAYSGVQHRLLGNLVGSGDLKINDYTQITGRVLGFSPINPITITSKISITAPTSIKEPLLEPVLQIHSTTGTPAATLNQGDGEEYRKLWMQIPDDTNYNAAFVAGDSPNRPQEIGSGLHNYVRLQENWCGTTNCSTTPEHTVSIKGSFIQLQRSTFATGPYVSYLVDPAGNYPKPINNISLNMFGDDSSTQTSLDYYWAKFGEPYPYYVGGKRKWGFDVGLLSQSPDLFSTRFTVPVTKAQNYYRQVSREDDWVKTLLCAAEPPTGGTLYSKYAVPTTEHPPEGCNTFTKASLPY